MLSEKNKVQLQKASPQHAKIAAGLIYDTDPHLFDYMFANDKESALRFFESEWQQERSLFSHSLCTLVVNAELPMGIEIGFDHKTKTELDALTGHTGARAIKPEVIPRLIETANYLPYLMPPIQDEGYYIAHLATTQYMRGRGLGELLLKNAFARAAKRGYRICELDVASNSQAVNFYHRMGMAIVSESRVIEFEKNGIPSHYRMAKQIG